MARLIFLIVGFSFMTCHSLFGQCMLYEVPLNERISNSEAIVEGTIISSYCKEDSQGHLYTVYKVSSETLFKGSFQTAFFEFSEPGGVIGDRMEVVSHARKFSVGEKGVFILSKSLSNEQYKLFSGQQGFISIENGEVNDVFAHYSSIDELYSKIAAITGKQPQVLQPSPSIIRNQNNILAPVITSISPSTISAGTGSVLTIIGSGFGLVRDTNSVSFKDADNGGSKFMKPLSSEYVLWSPNEIQVKVPSEAGTGNIKVDVNQITVNSLTSLKIPFSWLNVITTLNNAYGTDLVDANKTGGYVWHFNTNFAQYGKAKASFLRAFNNWRCASFVNWSMGDVVSNTRTQRDNVNLVHFDDQNELPAGVLGSCYSYYNGCGTDVWYVNEYDIVFTNTISSSTTWNFESTAPTNSQYDFESVTLHELGHGQQLGHVINSTALMHYALKNGESKRLIDIDDLGGAKFILDKSKSTNVCGPKPMIPLNAGNCGNSDIAYNEENFITTMGNPALGKIKIRYIVVEKEVISVKLYNYYGQFIGTLVEGEKEAGEYNFEFDLQGLSPGMYILSLEQGGKIYHTKVVKAG